MVALNPVEDAVESVVCPVTLSVPLATRDDVAVTVPPVIDPPVRVLIVPVTVFRTLVKRFVDVAFVEVRFVKMPVTAERRLEKKVVEVAFVRVAFVVFRLVEPKFVEVAFVTESVVIVPLVMVVVARVEVLETERVPCEARDDVAVIEPAVKLPTPEIKGA